MFLTWRTKGKLMPENFPAGLFFRKADKCFGPPLLTTVSFSSASKLLYNAE
jgi:hypothetical protein